MPHIGFLPTGRCFFLLRARLGDIIRILLFLPVSPSWQPVSHFISFVRRYWCQQPSDAAPRCPAHSTLTEENVRLLLSVSVSGLLNKRLLVWLFLYLVSTWVDLLLYLHYLRYNLQMQSINVMEPGLAVPQTGGSKDTLWKDVHRHNCDFRILKSSQTTNASILWAKRQITMIALHHSDGCIVVGSAAPLLGYLTFGDLGIHQSAYFSSHLLMSGVWLWFNSTRSKGDIH